MKKVERKYVDKGQKWKEVTLDQAIHDLESHGYWKKGTTKQMLLEGKQLWTPFANYRIKSSSLNGSASLTEQLRLEIKRSLDKCHKEILPNVCKRLQTIEGYRAIEARIIELVIKEQITPSAAIAHIELEL